MTEVKISEERLKALFIAEEKLFKARVAIESLATVLAIEKTKSDDVNVLSPVLRKIYEDFHLLEITAL